MSDFGELCPLFNTGIFGEVVFPGPIYISLVGTLKNFLLGTGHASNTYTPFTFGRTVIVTEAFIKRILTNSIETNIHLRHKTSATIGLSGTIFGTCTLPATGSAHQPPGYKPFVAFTGKTFASSDVLCLCQLSTTVDSGCIGLMVRYKEK